MHLGKILIIEDDVFICDLYKRQLELAGLPTDGVGTGKKGLVALRQNEYDLILLDIMLPDINGLQVLKEIKKGERTQSIPVVLLTNLGQDEVVKEGFKLGADAYLIKAAYSPNQIVEEVKNILSKKQKKTKNGKLTNRKLSAS